jgi:hypothetical protein
MRRFARCATAHSCLAPRAAAGGALRARPAPLVSSPLAGAPLTAARALSLTGMFTRNRSTASEETLREELPEIFDRQPEEVNDYIRPDKTIFERLEDWWDWVHTFMAPVEKQVE